MKTHRTKKTYIRPEIWVGEMEMKSPLLAGSDKMTSTTGNSGIIYEGAGNAPARAGENCLWDDDDDSGWDKM